MNSNDYRISSTSSSQPLTRLPENRQQSPTQQSHPSQLTTAPMIISTSSPFCQVTQAISDSVDLIDMPKVTHHQNQSDYLRSMLLMAAMGQQVSNVSTLPIAPATPPGVGDNLEKFQSPPPSYHPILMMKMMMGNSSFLDQFTPPQPSLPTSHSTSITSTNQTISNPATPSPPLFKSNNKKEKRLSPNIDCDMNEEKNSKEKSKFKITNSENKQRRNRISNGSDVKQNLSYSSNRRIVPSTVSNPSSLMLDNHQPSSLVGPNPEHPIYRCHLCPYTGNSKLHFNAHMNTHFDHRCPHCDYTSRTEGRLKRHIRDFHSETPPDTWTGTGPLDIDSVLLEGAELIIDADVEISAGGTGPNPARNRKYRCKQCGYVAMDKHDFWEHSKDHIKSDKMLACPKCNFVTEYKHHLEYHLRNHFGSKPFKCAKCNYSCVNKSMLNSHMKSHSNIYQYRCDDCTYATKYCHSLKLHLRKYKHRPATVLNLDGTPNPYPVIDVYGTRRGPRPKKQQILSLAVTKGKSTSGTFLSNKLSSRNKMIKKSIDPAELPSKSETIKINKSTVGLDPIENVASKSANDLKKDLPSSLINQSSKQTIGNESSTNNSTPITLLKCNYCSFQTESKPDFSNHLLNHVVTEKISLLNMRKQQQQQQQQNVNKTKTNSQNDEPKLETDLNNSEEKQNKLIPLDLTKAITDDQIKTIEQTDLNLNEKNPFSTLLKNLLLQQHQTAKETDFTTNSDTKSIKRRKGQARKLLIRSDKESHNLTTENSSYLPLVDANQATKHNYLMKNNGDIDVFNNNRTENDEMISLMENEDVRLIDLLNQQESQDISHSEETISSHHQFPSALVKSTSEILESISLDQTSTLSVEPNDDLTESAPSLKDNNDDDDNIFDTDLNSEIDINCCLTNKHSHSLKPSSSLSDSILDTSNIDPNKDNDNKNNSVQNLMTKLDEMCSILPICSSTLMAAISQPQTINGIQQLLSSNPNLFQMLIQMLANCSLLSSDSVQTTSSLSSTQSALMSSNLAIPSISSGSIKPIIDNSISSASNDNFPQARKTTLSTSSPSLGTSSSASSLASQLPLTMNNSNINFLVNNTASLSTEAPNPTIDQMDNVNSLINKMHSVTFLMQEILLEMWSIKK